MTANTDLQKHAERREQNCENNTDKISQGLLLLVTAYEA